jgi:hypothetical protein
MRHSLWKSVEDFSGHGSGRRTDVGPLEPAACADSGAAPQPLRACSACAGDYEDPDRTAGGPDAEEQEGEADGEETSGDEFPAP